MDNHNDRSVWEAGRHPWDQKDLTSSCLCTIGGAYGLIGRSNKLVHLLLQATPILLPYRLTRLRECGRLHWASYRWRTQQVMLVRLCLLVIRLSLYPLVLSRLPFQDVLWDTGTGSGSRSPSIRVLSKTAFVGSSPSACATASQIIDMMNSRVPARIRASYKDPKLHTKFSGSYLKDSRQYHDIYAYDVLSSHGGDVFDAHQCAVPLCQASMHVRCYNACCNTKYVCVQIRRVSKVENTVLE